MYSIFGYAQMIADQVRRDAYASALRRVLRPGGVCLDLGTGTGFFAVLACRLGARKVIAIDPNDAIHVARQVAAANGCAERITFIQDLSTRVQLTERADVIVSDLRGILPMMGHHFPNLIDARNRLLAPGGSLIPQSDTLWAVPVEAAAEYARVVPVAEGLVHGINMEPTRPWIVNWWGKAQRKPEHLLATPRQWASLDYAHLEGMNVRGEAAWTVERGGTGHGLLLWFDTSLAEGVGFSNAPGQPELIYGNSFFPWPRPVPLASGDRVEVALMADLVGEDYIWRWNTRVLDPARPDSPKASFAQSTFHGTPLAVARLRKRAASHVPELDEGGQIDRFILGLMDGKASLGDLARRVQERFPARFPRWEDALTAVGDLAEKYSRNP
jgi:type I protein arginine methyltransferase